MAKHFDLSAGLKLEINYVFTVSERIVAVNQESPAVIQGKLDSFIAAAVNLVLLCGVKLCTGRVCPLFFHTLTQHAILVAL